MTRGKARFDVVPNPKRTFEVRAGDVRVEVLGTSFDVTYEVGRVSVDVAHGRVRVVAPDEEYVLTAGERVAVLVEERSPEEDKPTEVPEPLDPIAPEEGTDSAPSVKAARRVREARPERWQDMVDDGRFEDAANMLEVERTTPTLDTLDEYLLAADAMVHVGRPQRALDYLGQGLERFPDARSAAVAKFQRARILLRDAKRYEDAARAFASIADDAGAPSLHEDALAREIQAWARAGRPDMARARAKLYFERFPHGRRRKLVERYSGVTP
ncbi:MAG: FecR domain-containing protein [Myxococcota bacterium]